MEVWYSRAFVKDYITFTKAILSFAVGIPGVFVYLLGADEIKSSLWVTFLAIFFLALGVCALNQFQEYTLDALMDRTKSRPLVTQRIGRSEAIIAIFGLIFLSMVLIYTVLSFTGIAIFTVVVFLYNGIYTPFKRVSPYAVFPGALLGVIPPLLMWLLTKKSLLSLDFLSLMWFYFVWQMPHFWLLVLMHHKEYKKAGFPTMVEVLGSKSLARITYIWIVFTTISALMVVSYFMPKSNAVLSIILLHSIFILYSSIPLFKKDLSKKIFKKIFMQLNLYTLCVIGFLVFDKWITKVF